VAGAAFAAIIVHRYPSAAFVEVENCDEYSSTVFAYAILDDRGWPLWFHGMIGPREQTAEIFSIQMHKYLQQMSSGYGHDEMVLPEPQHSMYLHHSKRVFGIQIIT
jgi:hypothetical protein